MRRSPSLLETCALLSLVVGLLAGALGLLRPYQHAAWLVAYLLLVGFLAQALLSRGQAALLGHSRTSETWRQAALWNFGVVAVPAGVFANARLLVVLGGVSLIAALITFWRGADPIRRARHGTHALPAAYLLLIGVMAASSFIGIGLGWDRPWI